MKQIAGALGVTPAEFFGFEGTARADTEASSEVVALIMKPGALKLLRNYAKLTPEGREAVNRFAAGLLADGERGKIADDLDRTLGSRGSSYR